ncbi:MAG: TolC family protein [Deltaproteobacteria bacterium]|nr:TolC family protein [Deltaproteobacteria bacterium]
MSAPRPAAAPALGRLAAAVTVLSLVAGPVQAAPETTAQPPATVEASAGPAPQGAAAAAPDRTTAPAVGPKPAPGTAPATNADDEPVVRASAFSLPPADRTDPYGPRADDAPHLSREQVIRYALHNPLIKSADAKIDAMKAQARKANFAWLPVIETVTTLTPGANITCDDLSLQPVDDNGVISRTNDFQFQWCRPGGDPDLDIQTVQGYFQQLARAGVRVAFDANAVFPLFTFGKIRHTKRLAKAGVALAKLEKLQAQQETVKLVLVAHTTLLLARESQTILVDAKNVVDKAQRRVSGDLGGGGDDWDDEGDGNPDRDPNDAIEVELASIEVEQNMREALRVEALALAALWDLAGSAAPRGFDVREDRLEPYVIEGGRRSLADYKEIAIRERPEAHMARAAIQAREAQEKLARAAFLPDLGLAVSAGFARSNAVDREMNQLYYRDSFNYSRITAALAIRWRWDFYNTAFDLQRARAQLRAQEYQREAAELYLGQDVTTAYQDVVEAEHRIALAKRATELNWQLVVSLEQRDTVGGGNADKLLRKLKDWYKKRFEEAEAIHAHNEAVARLARATGTPLIAQGTPPPSKAPSTAP